MRCDPAAFALIYYGGMLAVIVVGLCVAGLLRPQRRTRHGCILNPLPPIPRQPRVFGPAEGA